MIISANGESCFEYNSGVISDEHKRMINGICKALTKESKDYKPEKTIENHML